MSGPFTTLMMVARESERNPYAPLMKSGVPERYGRTPRFDDPRLPRMIEASALIRVLVAEKKVNERFQTRWYEKIFQSLGRARWLREISKEMI